MYCISISTAMYTVLLLSFGEADFTRKGAGRDLLHFGENRTYRSSNQPKDKRYH